jgi:low molecular weight protein-tyrosine phosphatase
MSKKQILFLCTGNYYRSRYAEELFNYLAVRAGLNWEATSRGLAIERGRHNVGPIAPATVAALIADNISPVGASRTPLPCATDDLSAAEIIVAVKEAEHRELLAERFPGWENRTVYWHVHDTDKAHPDTALAELKQHVKGLAKRLAIVS